MTSQQKFVIYQNDNIPSNDKIELREQKRLITKALKGYGFLKNSNRQETKQWVKHHLNLINKFYKSTLENKNEFKQKNPIEYQIMMGCLFSLSYPDTIQPNGCKCVHIYHE